MAILKMLQGFCHRRPHLIMQPHCYLFLILLTVEFLIGRVSPSTPGKRLEACNPEFAAKNLSALCSSNTTVVDCANRNFILKAVPDTICGVKSTVYLNGNEIHKIQENDFRFVPNLEQLFLQDNKISSIHPNAFKRLFQLETLNLSNNKIEVLDPSGQTFQHLSALRELHLQNNQITRINKYSFLTVVGPGKTVHVYLEGNPVQCDCEVHALMSWARSQTIGGLEIRGLTCANEHMKSYEEMDNYLFQQCTANQNTLFDTVTCPSCHEERTNHGCNLHGAKQCPGEQMVCHKILDWKSTDFSSPLKITSKCDNYTSCMIEESKNQKECVGNAGNYGCHFCCNGPACTIGSIGGLTKDFTFDLSYIRDGAAYESYMSDRGHPSFLQEKERIVERIRKNLHDLAGGLDVYLIRFVPQQNQLQHEVVLKLRVTTLYSYTEDDIQTRMHVNFLIQRKFFSDENVVPRSLKLSPDNQDSRPCPEDTSYSADKGNITWPASPEDKVLLLCPYGSNGDSASSSAVRACLRQADGTVAWGEADYSSCSSEDDQIPITLDRLFEMPITARNAKAVSAILKRYMESLDNLTEKVVSNVVNKLEMLLHDSLLQQPDVVENVVECVSRVISSGQRFAKFERRTTLSQRLLNITGFISEKTPLINGSLMVVASNLAIAAHGVNASEISNVVLTVETDSTDGLLNNRKISVSLSSGNASRFSGSSSVLIPTQAVIASMTPEERLTFERISFVVHLNDTLFPRVETNESTAGKQTNGTEFCQQNSSLVCQREETHRPTFITTINSMVLSASVPGFRVEGLKENITLNFIHDADATNPRCVFWNTNTADGLGEWSGEGCGVVESYPGETTCGCNHLTNFALLMDVYQGGHRISDLDRKILYIISNVGCGVSLISLILTLLTYSCFRKLRHNNPSKILINLCLGLMLSNLVYLVGMQAYTFDNTAACKVVAVLLHYFLLSSLTWMAVEAFYMYLALILVFKTHFSHFILKCCLVGWGVPFVIVIVTLGVNSTDNYGTINSGLCWLRNPAFYAAFVGPVCLILLVNLLVFGLVTRRLFSVFGSNLSKTVRNSTIHRLKGAVGVVILLGLSWLFAIFAIGQASIAFYYLFAVFNSLQGLFIFIFYCLLKKDAVVFWKKSLPCSEEYGETSQTSSNSREFFQMAISCARTLPSPDPRKRQIKQ